jgi:hypothetical protein
MKSETKASEHNKHFAIEAADLLVMMEQIESINELTGRLRGGIGKVDAFASDTSRRCIALRDVLYTRYEIALARITESVQP